MPVWRICHEKFIFQTRKKVLVKCTGPCYYQVRVSVVLAHKRRPKMNAKVTKPEVAKSVSTVAPVAQPKDAAKPDAPVAEKKQLQVPSAATGFKAPTPIAKLERVESKPAQLPAVTQAKAAEPEAAQPEVALIKGVASMPQKAKPQLKMLRVIAKKHNHPGTALRVKRWHMYKEGMTLQHCKETEGLSHLDVLFYEEHKLVTMRDATEAEYKAALEAWQKSNEAKKTA
jgi:hypothetical protein